MFNITYFGKKIQTILSVLIILTVMVAANIGCAEEKLFYEDADGWFDITGIYVLNYPDNSGYPIKNSYVVISGNKDEYIATAVSKDLYFLGALFLIKTNEYLENSIAPPLEEFAVSFTATHDQIIKVRKFNIYPLIPFSGRTTTMEGTEAFRWIGIGPPLNGRLYACVSTEMGIISHPILCYRKIF